MEDVNDIARMEYILQNYDSVKLSARTTTAYRDSDSIQAKIIIYEKRINGKYYVAEAVPDSKRKEITVLSVYKNKAQQKNSVD